MYYVIAVEKHKRYYAAVMEPFFRADAMQNILIVAQACFEKIPTCVKPTFKAQHALKPLAYSLD